MSRYAIHPFYYPTSVVFIDDNRDFLQNLSLELDSKLAFILLTSPLRALAVLNSGKGENSLIGKFFSRHHEAEGNSLSSHVIDLDIDLIRREALNDKRFGQISVAVVDYDMPEMNGLDFCRKVQDPLVKKILLTGKADEKIAIKAFNSGLIDRFITKSDPDATANLNSAIGELQQQYFSDMERMLSDALAVGAHEFFRDPMFAMLFRELCDDLDIVEYYLCANPSGILMLAADGKSHLLIVQSREELLSEYEIALDNNAPIALLESLSSTEYIPYFWKTSGKHYDSVYADWREYLHPARAFKGKNWYYYAVIENPEALDCEQVFCYRDFLRQLDEQEPG